MTRNQRYLLRAFSIWTVYVWTTRIWNILRDESTSTAFKTVHSVLAVISIALAVAAWVVVTRVQRKERSRPVDVDVTTGASSS
jgi:hypothetical protein